MTYLKIFTDFLETVSTLDDAEAGRLFRAMLRYAADAEVTELPGNERYLWPAARQNVDRERECYERVCARNRKNRTGVSEPGPYRADAELAEAQAAAGQNVRHPLAATQAVCATAQGAAFCFDVASRQVQEKDKDKEKKDMLSYERATRYPADEAGGLNAPGPGSACPATAQGAAFCFDVASRLVQEKDKDKEKKDILSYERATRYPADEAGGLNAPGPGSACPATAQGAAFCFDVASRQVQEKDKDKEKKDILSYERATRYPPLSGVDELAEPIPDAAPLDAKAETASSAETGIHSPATAGFPMGSGAYAPINADADMASAAPNLTEVRAFIREKGLSVDPERFVRFYAENGWRDRDGRPVRSWRQKLLTWDSYGAKRSAQAAENHCAAAPEKHGAGSSNKHSLSRPGMGARAAYAQTPLTEEQFASFFVDLDHDIV